MGLGPIRAFLHSELRGDTERGRMVRSAGVTSALKVAATLIAFGASLLYARALGPHDYGLYAYVFAWAALLTIPAGLGLPSYLTREASKAPPSTSWLRRWADGRVLVAGAIASVVLGCAYFVPQAAGARWLFVIAAPLPLLNNLSHVRRSLLQARGWVARGQWPSLVLAPALVLVGLVAWWRTGHTLAPAEVMGAMTVAALVPLFLNHLQLERVAPISESRPDTSIRLRSALPFMWLGGLYLLSSRVDLIMLGTIRGGHAAGIYAVSARAAELVTFFLAASNMVIAPRIARLHHDGSTRSLQRLLTASALRVFLLSLPVALVFIVLGRLLLAELYGPAYADGAVALRILAGAQLVNVLAGSTGTILNMTGHERLTMWGVGLSVAVNVMLNAILIPRLGVEGAAIASGVSLAGWNVILWYWVRKRLRLRSSALNL